MKVLIAGSWDSELHEEPVFKAFKELGHDPIQFKWHTYFKPQNLIGNIFIPILKAQFKYMLGPIVYRVNRDLVDMVSCEQPKIIFIYRGNLVYKKTLVRIKQILPATILICYNNDDPFSPHYPSWKWRHFIASVSVYDLVLAYRIQNLDEFKKAGAKRVELLRSWFIPEMNRPVELSNDEKAEFGCDVVFIGHYEDDGRLEYLEEIVRKGWHLRIFGPGYQWNSVLRRSSILNKHVPVRLVWGPEYNLALCGAKVALCFFSRLNRDTYTRRCFEIPASGTVMLSEYSKDIASMYTSNMEALFFGCVDEMIERIDWMLSDDDRRKEIAFAGNRRVWRDGHDIVSRVECLLKLVNELR